MNKAAEGLQFFWNYVIIIFLVIILSSCKSSFQRIMKSGSVAQDLYIETIPFNFDKKLPIISVEIEGIAYPFLFDTGAPTVLSIELASKINYTSGVVAKINDSQGSSKKQESVIIPSLRIGKIEFNNIGAVIIDYNSTFELSCYDFVGIIGANLMAKSNWKIDYEKEQITFSDDFDAFKIPKGSYIHSFTLKGSQKTPEVTIQIGETKAKHLTFDTGATGSFSLKKAMFQNEIKDNPQIIAFGISSVGVYGAGDPSESIYAIVNELKFGDIILEGQIFEFDESSDLIGNKFLKNYQVFLDWEDQKIYMSEQKKFQDTIIYDFGFKLRTIENQLFISSIINNSGADRAGLNLNDKILSIDNDSYDFVPASLACKMLFSKLLKDKKEIDVVIERGEEKLKFNLKKEILLE